MVKVKLNFCSKPFHLINCSAATILIMDEMLISPEIFLTGTIIFFARIFDVSLGTLRIISIVNGRKWMAFGLGFVEILIWISVVSTVIQNIKESPVLVLFFAFGFATGNFVGIKIEKWLSLGYINFRVISRNLYNEMASIIREAGYPVTVFLGKGLTGQVGELYIVCTQRDLKEIRSLIKKN